MTAVMLTITSGHDLSDRYVMALLGLQETGLGGVLFRESGPNLSTARNALVLDFLETDREWAWFVDADMDCPPETLGRLIKASETTGHKVVGALCAMVGATRPIPNIFYDDDEYLFQTPINYPDHLVEVKATGTGCLLIHRDVLEKIHADRGQSDNAWFWEEIRTNPQGNETAVSEDLNFCLRAREAGFTVAVDCTTHVGHHKSSRVWWPADCRHPYYPPVEMVRAPLRP